MDHDRIFKELITVFFVEFVEAFRPNVARYLDATSILFLDKEVFTDVTEGETHDADLVVKAQFRGADAFFLVHVEAQASARPNFPKRMFRYFARLHEKYDVPVYPVVVFSYDRPLRAAPSSYSVAFPDETVLEFKYKVIQLNRMSWREFVNRPNAAATALMAKMKVEPNDRVTVRSECMRLLRTLRLDPAKSKIIGGFVETYLKLTTDEMRQYERQFAELTPKEQEETMGLVSSWEQKGIDIGIERGKESLVVLQIKKCIGSISAEAKGRIDLLSADQLDVLGLDLLDFSSHDDLDVWLDKHTANVQHVRKK